MNHLSRLLILPAMLAFAAGVWAQPAAPVASRITVNPAKPGIKTSPLLYGIFFEEINRAGDGGIYAEMVQNRSFEDAATPVAWTLVQGEGSDGAITIESAQPLNDKNPHSLKVEVRNAGKGRVGAANEGFKGMQIKQGETYNLSLYARAGEGFKGALNVTLESADGAKTYASGKVEGLSAEWKQFSVALKADAGDPAGRLAICSTSAGVFFLDMVSLFPAKTWKDRPNGLRPDLMEMVAGMKPAFVRFPGGCYVEGDQLANAFRWKDSIGDIARRPGHKNLWGYRSNDGLGYYEYLQMCEDLGSEPLYVINCGMAHKDHVEKADLGPWIQDALDAIEYANGPADSQWGALRAKAGHPAPFNLKYMEIGNENGGPVYDEHYTMFHDAIMAKYPQMHLVTNTVTKTTTPEINDEHYYSSPEFFIHNFAKYDKYDRSKFKIYVGEYAVTQDCGLGNLRAAIGEAVFMAGMERNSDVVALCSYAPLFVHPAYKRWNPNAIVFNCSQCYGTPSYHLQAMFAANRGDVIVPAECESPMVEESAPVGTVGFGTWDTQAEFKDLKVAQGDKVLFQSDFSKGTKGWKLVGGEWKVVDGALRFTGTGREGRAIVEKGKFGDCTITLKARKISGAEGFLVMFRARDARHKSWWNVGGWGNHSHGLELPGLSSDHVSGSIEKNRWYEIKIEQAGGNIRCYLDGKLIHDFTAISHSPSLYAVAGLVNATNELVLKVVNTNAAALETTISIPGASLQPTATVIAMTSADPKDENSFEQPTKVAPVSKTLDVGSGPEFKYTFPGNSVTIFRLKSAGGR